MSKPPDVAIKLSDTLTLCEYQSPKNGSFGWWLYDNTRGMNLAMRAATEQAAFVEALEYYQYRTAMVEAELNSLKEKVDKFVSQFCPEDDNDY